MMAGLATWFVPAGRVAQILAVAVVTGVGGALAASGHASAANPQWLMRPAVFLHGAAIAAWAGSLVPFAMVLRGGGDSARKMLRRFCAAILPVIAALILTGAILGVVQVGRVEALWTTAYGRVLLAKLALLLFLFTLAAINRFSLTPAFARREPKAARQFARSVRMEIVLVCAILAVASLWRFTPPPRSLPGSGGSTGVDAHPYRKSDGGTDHRPRTGRSRIGVRSCDDRRIRANGAEGGHAGAGESGSRNRADPAANGEGRGGPLARGVARTPGPWRLVG